MSIFSFHSRLSFFLHFPHLSISFFLFTIALSCWLSLSRKPVSSQSASVPNETNPKPNQIPPNDPTNRNLSKVFLFFGFTFVRECVWPSMAWLLLKIFTNNNIDFFQFSSFAVSCRDKSISISIANVGVRCIVLYIALC